MVDYTYKPGLNSQDEFIRLAKECNGDPYKIWRAAKKLRDGALEEGFRILAMLYQCVLDMTEERMELDGIVIPKE